MCGCDFPQRESVKHVVVDSPSAQRIWKHFQHIFGICSSSLLQQLKLSEWWISKAKSTDFKEILSFVPVCICWEPWKRRNKAKCDGVELSSDFLIANVTGLIEDRFSGTVFLFKCVRSEILVLKELGLLNIRPGSCSTLCCYSMGETEGGCSEGNPGQSGGGAILRTHTGDWYGNQTNMVAEVRAFGALFQDLQKCVISGVHEVDIEVDSLVLVHILCKKVGIPWNVVYNVRCIWRLMEQLDYRLSHTFRERIDVQMC